MRKRLLVLLAITFIGSLPFITVKISSLWHARRAAHLIGEVSKLRMATDQSAEIGRLQQEYGDGLTVSYWPTTLAWLGTFAERIGTPRWWVQADFLQANGLLVRKRIRIIQPGARTRWMHEAWLTEVDAAPSSSPEVQSASCNDFGWKLHPGLMIRYDPRHVDLWKADLVTSVVADEYRGVTWSVDLRCLSRFGRCKETRELVPQWAAINERDALHHISNEEWLNYLKSRAECSDYLRLYIQNE